MREKRADIEAAKGVAILLVVFGHLVARQDPSGVVWYEPLRRAVYSFHMPLFLYLSGLAAVYSGLVLRPRAQFGRVAAARAQRLLLPFLALGLLVVLGKLALAPLLHVDNAPSGLGSGLLALIWDTGRSPALSVWYLFVLFCLTLGTLALLNGHASRLPWLCGAALALFWLNLPSCFYLDRIFTYAPFFLAGALCGSTGPRWEGWMDRHWPAAMALFFAGLAAVARLGPVTPLGGKTCLLLMGMISLPAIHGWVRSLARAPLLAAFLWLGRHCFAIYLFNTLFIGLAKALLLTAWPWNNAHFCAFAAALMACGLLGPIALKRCALQRVALLDRLTS